jgi:transcription initiation factor IIE alpha subunit
MIEYERFGQKFQAINLFDLNEPVQLVQKYYHFVFKTDDPDNRPDLLNNFLSMFKDTLYNTTNLDDLEDIKRTFEVYVNIINTILRQLQDTRRIAKEQKLFGLVE